ncbi:MAG: PEGA domain-containing protein, partial [Deltaproteobacteria bacterium]|nr:PEGA domain-containing protein [Deltaproteobacteria bacterium]
PAATQPAAEPAFVPPSTELTVLEPVITEPTVVEPHPTTEPTVRRGGVSPRVAVAPSRSEAASEALPAPTSEVATEVAIVRINATPWADVEIDGRHLGATPLVHVELAPGPHTIVLVNPVLSRVRTEHVELAPGERRDVIVAM